MLTSTDKKTTLNRTHPEDVLLYNQRIMNSSRLLRRPRPAGRVRAALVLGPALVLSAFSGLAGGQGTAAAQAPSPCALLTTDDIQPIAPNVSIPAGVPSSIEAAASSSCLYAWGDGVGRVKLDVRVADASRMFPGSAPDAIKQRLQSAVVPETADTLVPDVGEGAVFKAASPTLVQATAYLKDRILQVRLDGYDALANKDQVIRLMKSAASKL